MSNTNNKRVEDCSDKTRKNKWADDQTGRGGKCSERPTEEAYHVTAPRLVESLARHCALHVAAGCAHSAVLAEWRKWGTAAASVVLFTFGLNDEGQLGHGDRAPRDTPMAVPRLLGLAPGASWRLSCGDFHTAALTAEGELYTWGYGRIGRLGHGDEEDRLEPARVLPPLPLASFTALVCGATFTVVALASQREGCCHVSLWATGEGFDGQLGTGHEGPWYLQTYSPACLSAPPPPSRSRGRRGVREDIFWGSEARGPSPRPSRR